MREASIFECHRARVGGGKLPRGAYHPIHLGRIFREQRGTQSRHKSMSVYKEKINIHTPGDDSSLKSRLAGK